MMVFSEMSGKRKADVYFSFLGFGVVLLFAGFEIKKRDENVTVFMVKKYLVRKLGLSNEAEVISLSLSLIFNNY